MDRRKYNGGHKTAGRKSKVAEERTNEILLSALKRLYGKDTDEEAKIAFIVKLHNSERGKNFIAEHLFGKATDKIDFQDTTTRRELEITLTKEDEDYN